MGSSVASIRFFGDALVPAELSKLFGCEPTDECIKGEPSNVGTLLPDGTRVAKTGRWILEAGEKTPVDINGQVIELLGKLPGDLDVWKNIRSKYNIEVIDIFCGVFKSGSGDRIYVTADTLSALGLRGIEFIVDAYSVLRDDEK